MDARQAALSSRGRVWAVNCRRACRCPCVCTRARACAHPERLLALQLALEVLQEERDGAAHRQPGQEERGADVQCGWLLEGRVVEGQSAAGRLPRRRDKAARPLTRIHVGPLYFKGGPFAHDHT
jgi:hypothetical protein